jgi:hypothetical protein
MSVRPDVDVSLTSAQRDAFLAQAVRLGHDPDAVSAGLTVTNRPGIPSVAAARSLLPATPVQRARRQAVFFAPEIALRRAIGQGVHDRLEAAVFADGDIDLGDEAGAARHFPFPAKATSVLRKSVATGEVWDLSARGAEFGLDDLDDLLAVVNVGELVLAPGAAVIVRGNLLVLVVQRLVCLSSPADSHGCGIQILPTPFSVDPRRDRVRAADGRDGIDGIDGAAGVRAETRPGFLGPRLVAPAEAGQADGQPGSAGTPGGAGAAGASGGPSKLADITIGELVGTLTLRAGAGAGLPGGAGGDGGRGGAGGAGAAGVRAVGATVPAGRGGDGGAGGDGGRGGRGGSGGISSNVFVTVPVDATARIRVFAEESPGGRGGSGGRAGGGGRAGSGGAADRPGDRAGQAGRDGAAGAPGAPGRDGRTRPAPPVYINEDRWRNA